MEFLGIGYQEILVILVVMLVVVGPERLPTMAYQIGRAVRTLQTYARVVRDEFRDEFDYLDEQMKTVKGGVDDLNRTLREGEREFRKDLDNVVPAEVATGSKPSNVVPFGTSATSPDQNPPSTNGAAANGNGASSATEPEAEETKDEPPKAPLVF